MLALLQISDFDAIQSYSKIHIYIPCCSGPELGVPPDVELEVSLVVDGVFLLGLSGVPAVVGIDGIT